MNFQRLWAMSPLPGRVFGTCLGEQNGVYFPFHAPTLALLQQMISRVNFGVCSYADVWWVSMIQGRMGEA